MPRHGVAQLPPSRASWASCQSPYSTSSTISFISPRLLPPPLLNTLPLFTCSFRVCLHSCRDRHTAPLLPSPPPHPPLFHFTAPPQTPSSVRTRPRHALAPPVRAWLRCARSHLFVYSPADHFPSRFVRCFPRLFPHLLNTRPRRAPHFPLVPRAASPHVPFAAPPHTSPPVQPPPSTFTFRPCAAPPHT